MAGDFLFNWRLDLQKGSTMNNVHQLHTIQPSRSEALREFCTDQARFFIQQASNPEGVSAALSIATSVNGRTSTKMAGVDVEHAAVMLAKLDEVRAKLLKLIANEAPDLLDTIAPAKLQQFKTTNVLPLHRHTVTVSQAVVLNLRTTSQRQRKPR